ncbi:MAG: hypothetical protein JXR07_14070 [Reichenbachiella sp.]
MINFKKHNFQSLCLIAALFLFSCEDENMAPDLPVVGEEGFYVVNEGGWGHGNTSISYFNKLTGSIVNDIYYLANNNTPLGDQAQSMSILDTLGYISVQNSGKIEVVDINSFQSVTTIDEDIVSPRYIVGYNSDKAYVSDWGDGFSSFVRVIDLTTNEVTKSISTGAGTNQLLIHDDKLYAVNAGGFDRDNTMVIINTSTDELVNTIELGDNPNSLQIDADGNIWVLCGGYTAYDENWNVDLENSTKGSLIQLNSSGQELLNLSLAEFSKPDHLSITQDGQSLFYLYNSGIYKIDITASELPTTPFIDKSFYGLGIDPVNGNIIGCEAPDFTSAGNVIQYAEDGSMIETISVGIAPNNITYK